jgi:hypothetical protein
MGRCVVYPASTNRLGHVLLCFVLFNFPHHIDATFLKGRLPSSSGLDSHDLPVLSNAERARGRTVVEF